MIRLILATLLIFSSLSESWASGSNTVFLPLRSRQYTMSDYPSEIANNPQLQYYVENSQTRVYLVRVSPAVFNTAAHFARHGYQVRIDFEGLQSIVFCYYPSVDAIIGFTSTSNPVILGR